MSKENHAAMDAATSISGKSDKQQWAVIHYNDEDPDEQFEIVESSRVAPKSQAILLPLIYVSVQYGNTKLLGSLVDIFDDYNYVKKNFEKIKEEFLKDHPGGLKPRHAFRSIPVQRIKITEKEAQTDPAGIMLPMESNLEMVYELIKKKEGDITLMRHNIVTFSIKINEGLKTPRRRSLISKSAKAFPRRRKPSTMTNTESSSKEDTNEDSDTDNDNEDDDIDEMVTIGCNNTKIPRSVYKTLPWNSYTATVRKLLMTLFDRDTLATHTLTGKPSPAFINAKKPAKMRLDPLIVNDIVQLVTRKCGISQSLARGAITSKCADENKMMRKRMAANKEKDDVVVTGDKEKDATEKKAGLSSTEE